MSAIQATISVACLILALVNLFIITDLRRKDKTVKPWHMAAAAAYIVSLPVMYEADPGMRAPDTLHVVCYVALFIIAVLSMIRIAVIYKRKK